MSERLFSFHDESTSLAHSSNDSVFPYLADPKVLAAHMGKSSMMMLGSRLSIETDGGRMIGSKIRLNGSIMGIPISLEEVFIERHVPLKKVWETIGSPKLLVIAHYRMGFDVPPAAIRQ